MSQTLQVYDQNMQSGQYGALGSGYIQQVVMPRPGPFELLIEKIGDKIHLDYGSELRLLMAEPVAGMKLREALELLKEALKP
jgi:hypothetical protein